MNLYITFSLTESSIHDKCNEIQTSPLSCFPLNSYTDCLTWTSFPVNVGTTNDSIGYAVQLAYHFDMSDHYYIEGLAVAQEVRSLVWQQEGCWFDPWVPPSQVWRCP